MKGTLSGVLNLNKPGGLTSRAVVDMVVRPLRGTKVGHAGTLDPLATGVLVVCVGAATRLIEYVQRMSKTYRTTVLLGARSDTLDADGRVIAVESPRVPSEPEIRTAMTTQIGTISQIPPQYSALKVQGRRAYDMARAGHAVDLAPRQVLVRRIDVLAYDWPRLDLEIDCGSGTYIRSIARDVGESLECGGLVEVLTRTRIGPFTLVDALDPLELTAESISSRLLPALEAVTNLPRLPLSPAQIAAIGQGRVLTADQFGGAVPAGEVALLGPDGALVAIAERIAESGRVEPRRVLGSE